MPPLPKVGKRERPSNSSFNSFRKISQNLRSQLTWIDLLVGFGSTVVIAMLLVGFRYQIIPEYKVGDIAVGDVRALQDVTFEDKEATENQREIARQNAPVVYILDTVQVAARERDLAQFFAQARDVLAQKQVPSNGNLSRARRAEALAELETQVGKFFPATILPLMLQERFNTTLENQALKVLDTVLRGFIVLDKDWAQFRQDQRKGVLYRDNASMAERSVTDAAVVRNISTAKEYLRQFHLEFPDLSVRDRGQLFDFLEGLLIPTLVYNPQMTEARRAAAAARVSPVEVHIKQGKTIVRTGEEITPPMVLQLRALMNLQKPRSLLGQFLGFFCFVGAFIYGLWRYFVYYQNRHRRFRKQAVLILVVLFVSFAVMRLMTGFADILGERMSMESFRGPFNLYYLVPFAFGAVLVGLLVDVNLAIITSVLISTFAGLFYGDIYIGIYALIGGLAGIYGVRQYKDRAAIIKAGLTIGLMSSGAIVGFDLMNQVPIFVSATFVKLGSALASGLLASGLASMLLPALESLFQITTDIRLLELSNLNAPILRRLAVDAPGTYHHSLMVGTLSEAAAESIGANPLLVRVGAYYHDLGKVLKPEYFVENQAFGINKHESLSPSMSCLILASHVKEGTDLAKEIGLTQAIRDLIPQHHGTRIMTYFYRKAKESQADKDQVLDDADFRYPGPRPQTKEAAILMMADSVEAASRTLNDPTPAQIQGMINRLVDAVLADNQFDECDITLREIGLVKESFFKILTGIYHRRIDYPGYDFRGSEKRPARPSITNSSPKQAKAV